MKNSLDRLQRLTETWSQSLAQEHSAALGLIAALQDAVKSLQAETADRRLQQLQSQIKKIQTRWNSVIETAQRDFVVCVQEEVEALKRQETDLRLGKILSGVADVSPFNLNRLCESVLDRILEVTGAERGFILFCLPDSTEADVFAARNFQTTNLSLGEYQFSRTVLREMFERASSVLLADALSDPEFSGEISVVNLQLRAVLATPLQHGERIVGAVYLENNSAPCAFEEDDRALLEKFSRFFVSYLDRTRLLPFALEPARTVFLDARKAPKEIIGEPPQILALLKLVERIADSPATVLIEGESGVGKELVARALHYQSARREHPFVAINCAAIPENLLESELFGHEKGAFTGAGEQHLGRLEQANGGTVFLDEVNELAYPLQAKLLRFLQSNEFVRLGGKHTVRVDVRVTAATGKSLKEMVQAEQFNAALFYRLNVIPVSIPPLREHRQDIPLLVDHFASKFSAMYGRALRVEPEVIDWLMDCPFPGNVRELENLMHRLVALAAGDSIRLCDLPPDILPAASKRVDLAKNPLSRIFSAPPKDLAGIRQRKQQIRKLLAEQERSLLTDVLKACDGNFTQAAKRLGIHRVTLHKMMRRERIKM